MRVSQLPSFRELESRLRVLCLEMEMGAMDYPTKRRAQDLLNEIVELQRTLVVLSELLTWHVKEIAEDNVYELP